MGIHISCFRPSWLVSTKPGPPDFRPIFEITDMSRASDVNAADRIKAAPAFRTG
jgi:hypothetical protein